MGYIIKKDMGIDLMAQDMGLIGKTTEILPLCEIKQDQKWGERHIFGGPPLIFTKKEAERVMARHVAIYGLGRPPKMEKTK